MTGKRRAGRPARNGPASAPGAGLSVSTVPRKTRRQLRTERRQRRRRLGAVGIAAVVLLVAVVAAAIGFGVHSATSGKTQPVDPETTLLVSLRGTDGSALASMLAAHDTKGKQGLELLVPGRLITDVCGYGTEQFGQILTLPRGESLSRLALSQVLSGATIDGSWTMSPASLARLVDAVGGVRVDVDTDVTQAGAGGTTVVLVPAGKEQHLDGRRAAAFAAYQGPNDDATAILSRFQSVFQAAIVALPPKPAQAQQILTRAGAQSTLPLAQTSALLLALAHDEQAETLLPLDLPTKPIDTGSGQPSYRVDQPQLTTLIRQRLAPSLPAASELKHASVLIQNGTGAPDLVQSACNRLLPAGYQFAGSGNASNFNYTKSQVVVFDTTVSAARIGDDVARRLGLPLSDVVASTQGQNVADVVVILGRDYRP